MINPELLIHSATAYTQTGIDAKRQPIYDDGVALSKIRINLTKGFSNGSNGLEISDNMTLKFDCEASLPGSWIPAKGMKIEFNNESYTIKSVKASYGLSDSVEFYTAELV